MRRTPPRRRQKGIALLLVLIAVVLISALAVEIARTSATQRRVGRNVMNDFLLRSAVDGRTHILRAALRYDATNGDAKDAEDDVWSWYASQSDDRLSSWGDRGDVVLPDNGEFTVAYNNTDVELLAWCEDERSKLNLLGLSRPEETSDFTFTRETLTRLIDEFREDTDLDLTDSDAHDMVEDLIEWLQDQGEEDDNPIPPVAAGRGKLQSVDDLLRVPGGLWKRSMLYDARDPSLDPDEVSDDDSGDSEYARANGIPGLFRYLTVHAETGATPPLRININTAPLPVMRALFDEQDRDLAEAIVDHRREGVGGEDDAGDESEDVGFFGNKSELSRVEGLPESLDTFPRLNYFADVRSDVYSLNVIATMVTGTIEGDWDEEDDEDDGPRDITSAYEYREIVQRVDEGFLTLFRERRPTSGVTR